MTAKTTSTMHIGELAERTGLSLRTIRHYDDVGLLPATARTEGGFRVYSEADAARLMLIKQMKPLGFSLEEMAEILGLLDRGGPPGPRTPPAPTPGWPNSWNAPSTSAPRWPATSARRTSSSRCWATDTA